MQRLTLSIAAGALLAVAANAQCFEQNFGTLMPLAAGQAGYGDDVAFDPQSLGFAFPMGGTAATYDSCQVSENGIMYLTNGLAATNGPIAAGSAYQPLNRFLGDVIGDDPRIAPLFSDLWSQPANGGGVFYNDTISGKFIVTWHNMVEWYATTIGGAPQQFSFQVQILSSGEIQMFHDGRYTGTVDNVNAITPRTGVSEGNAVADPGAVDLSSSLGQNLTSFCMYEEWPFGGVFDLNGTFTQYIYLGTGYLGVASPCAPAYHENFGIGCYNISDSFYQFLPDASTAPAELDGNSMTMLPVGSDYLVTWGTGIYVPPAVATPLTLADDGEVGQVLSTPFPVDGGTVTTLYVAANAVVSAAPNAYATTYVPSADGALNSAVTAWFSHHDYNPTEAGSGQVTFFEAGTTAYFTWENVESYSNPAAANQSTLQFQFDSATGQVTIIWVQIDGDPTSVYGSAHLIGWSSGGPSNNAGETLIGTAAPFVTSPINSDSLSLIASGAPTSTGATGSTVTYTTDNMLEYGGGVYIGMNIVSINQSAAGLPLFIIGAPGCQAYVTTLDLTQTMAGLSSTGSVTFNIPSGVPSGFEIYSQSVNLVQPGSLNTFGLTTSNGVKTYISSF